MTFDIEPGLFSVTFRGRGYDVSSRPNNLEFAGQWWWLLFNDTWVRTVQRESDHATAAAPVIAWLALNAVNPDEDSATAERGPAWTTTERDPLVVEYGNATYRCWPYTTPSQPGETDAEPQTNWAVQGPNGRQLGPLVDCDDTIVEVLHAVRRTAEK
ncbi:MAG: hypothetical protein ABJF01_14685 [bacterium]